MGLGTFLIGFVMGGILSFLIISAVFVVTAPGWVTDWTSIKTNSTGDVEIHHGIDLPKGNDLLSGARFMRCLITNQTQNAGEIYYRE